MRFMKGRLCVGESAFICEKTILRAPIARQISHYCVWEKPKADEVTDSEILGIVFDSLLCGPKGLGMLYDRDHITFDH